MTTSLIDAQASFGEATKTQALSLVGVRSDCDRYKSVLEYSGILSYDPHCMYPQSC